MTATASVPVQEKSRTPWWLILIEGIALIILGILFLTNTAATTVIFIQVLGIYWLIRGILYIVAMFLDHTAWGWKLFAGVLGIIAGIVVLNHPIWSPFVVGSVLVIILAIQAIIVGIIGLIQAFQGAGWGAGILGAVSIVIGAWLLFNVGAATFALPWVVGILAIVGGIFAIIMAFRVK
ncbi:MAG: HdeD family acid-resistance protein [Chloroflexota bacterium]|nr:HdeD family acid-resistance protein [Chloroflexota bacterium]